MPTYTDKKIQNIIDAYHEIGSAMNEMGALEKLPEALEEMEAALTNIDTAEYTETDQGFISSMCFYHRKAADLMVAFEKTPALMLERLKEHHTIYRADIIEVEAILTPKIESYAINGLEVCGASR